MVPILSILEDKDLPRPLSSMSSRYLRMTVLVVVSMVKKKKKKRRREKTVQVSCVCMCKQEEKKTEKGEKMNRYIPTNRPFIFFCRVSIG